MNMNNLPQLLIAENGNITTEQKKFVELHREIIFCGNIATDYMIEMAYKLKEMRDQEIYRIAGYDTFSDYVEGAVGIKERQAYKYIKICEDLPNDFLHSSAKS